MTEYTNEALVDIVKNTKETAERMRYLLELYQRNYLYILKICKKYSRHEEVDDLLQESFFGLNIAVDRYDVKQGIPFMNYAAICIETVIRQYISDCCSAIRLPAYIKRDIFKLEKAKKVFIQENGRDPSDPELAEILSVSIAQVKRLTDRLVFLRTASLDKVINDNDDELTLSDTIPDPIDHYEELTDRIDSAQRQDDIWSEVDRLKDNESQVIREYFVKDKTLEDIGRVKGCTRENVRQIRNKALNKLKASTKIKRLAEYDG